jgi:hypothetical protein
MLAAYWENVWKFSVQGTLKQPKVQREGSTLRSITMCKELDLFLVPQETQFNTEVCCSFFGYSFEYC